MRQKEPIEIIASIEANMLRKGTKGRAKYLLKAFKVMRSIAIKNFQFRGIDKNGDYIIEIWESSQKRLDKEFEEKMRESQ